MTTNYLSTLSTKELLNRHCQMPHMQAKVNEELIHRGAIVKRSETPFMKKLLADQLAYQRKIAGGC